MKKKTTFTDIAALENELAEIAPLVRQGFSQLGGPSLRVEAAIRREAGRWAGRKDARPVWPLHRIIAAAAGFVLLLGGGVQVHLTHQARHNAQSAHNLLNLSATQASAEHALEGPTGLANRLLDMQGLDEEGFFRAEEEEPLWL